MKNLALYLAICLLVAGAYALPDAHLKWACLMLLAALWLVTPVPSKAANDGEDALPRKGAGS